MKRRWIISLFLLPLVVGVGLLVKYWPSTVDDNHCGRYYHTYLHLPGIRTTFIQGKTLNDTLRVDLTLLQATTPDGWKRLCRDFEVPEPDSATRALMQQGDPDIVLSLLNSPADFADTVHVAAVSRVLQCVSIFHVTTEDQFDALVGHHIDQLIASDN